MITPDEKKEMLTIFRKHYDNLKMRCDIDNATLMLVILPAMQEYKLNKPAVINQVCEHQNYRQGWAIDKPCICNDCGEEL